MSTIVYVAAAAVFAQKTEQCSICSKSNDDFLADRLNVGPN